MEARVLDWLLNGLSIHTDDVVEKKCGPPLKITDQNFIEVEFVSMEDYFPVTGNIGPLGLVGTIISFSNTIALAERQF